MNVSRIYRLLRLIALLQSNRGYSANELAEELSISKRTLFRDLNSLELARVPYYFDNDAGCYRIGNHFFLPPVNLTLQEALSMLLLTRRLKNETNAPMLTEGKKAASKIEGILPGPIREHIGNVIDSVSMHLAPLADHTGADVWFEKLSAAIVTKNRCRLRYYSFFDKGEIAVTVNPLRLVFMHRAWYLLAWSLKEKQLRTYKLIRILKLTVQKKKFITDHSTELESHFGDAWTMIPEGKLHNVKLHFHPMVASNVAEVNWHKSQQITWNNDKSIEYHVTVDGLGEIVWWILGYGDKVTVREPKELVDKIAEIARNMLSNHTQEKPCEQ